jgi:hypothetical protein
MSHIGSVRVTVTVDLDPAAAFEVFTEEIGQWYRAGLSGMVGHDRPETLRFEPGVGGRVLERSGPDEAETEQARVTVWDPGERLVFVDQRSTEVEVSFEPIGERTRVVLEHRGLETLPPDRAATVAKHSWKRLAAWFEQYVEAGTHRASDPTTDDHPTT